jgi:hypothetical protein
MEWVKIEELKPKVGQNVIAVGTWVGEINGIGEGNYMGIGEWTGTCVAIDSDTYTTDIVDVKHWMPIPAHP